MRSCDVDYMKYLVVTDSTIANQRFSLAHVLCLLDTRKDAMTKMSSHIFVLAKDYRTMTSGWQGAPYFRKYDQELVSKREFR